jgi:hypothetical protein
VFEVSVSLAPSVGESFDAFKLEIDEDERLIIVLSVNYFYRGFCPARENIVNYRIGLL